MLFLKGLKDHSTCLIYLKDKDYCEMKSTTLVYLWYNNSSIPEKAKTISSTRQLIRELI